MCGCCCRGRSFSGRTTLWITTDNGEVRWRRRYKNEGSSATAATISGEPSSLLASYQQAADPWFEVRDVADMPFVRVSRDSDEETTGRQSQMNGLTGLAYRMNVARSYTDGAQTLHYLALHGSTSAVPSLLVELEVDPPFTFHGWAFVDLRFNGSDYGLGSRNADGLYPAHALIPPGVDEDGVTVYAIEKNWVWRYTYSAGTFGTTLPGNPESAAATRVVEAVTRFSSSPSNLSPGQLYHRNGVVWALGYHSGPDAWKLESWDPYSGSQLSSVDVEIEGYGGCIWVDGERCWAFSPDGSELMAIEVGGGSVSSWSLTYNPGTGSGPVGLGPPQGFLCDDGGFCYVLPWGAFGPPGQLVKYNSDGLVYAKSLSAAGTAFPAREGRVVWAASSAVRVYDAEGNEVGTLPGATLSNVAVLPNGLMAMAGNLPA